MSTIAPARVYIERLELNEPKGYWTFWVRFVAPGAFTVASQGWKWILSKRCVGTPGINKGNDKFIRTIEINSPTYDKIGVEVVRLIEETMGPDYIASLPVVEKASRKAEPKAEPKHEVFDDTDPKMFKEYLTMSKAQRQERWGIN